MAKQISDTRSKQVPENLVKITSININGIREKLQETIQLAQDESIDVTIINETKLTPNIPIKLKGYNIFRKDKPTVQGGVAIIVKNRILAQEITLPRTLQGTNTSTLLITLTHHPNITYIATLYSNPQTNINNRIPLLKHLEQYNFYRTFRTNI